MLRFIKLFNKKKKVKRFYTKMNRATDTSPCIGLIEKDSKIEKENHKHPKYSLVQMPTQKPGTSKMAKASLFKFSQFPSANFSKTKLDRSLSMISQNKPLSKPSFKKRILFLQTPKTPNAKKEDKKSSLYSISSESELSVSPSNSNQATSLFENKYFSR